MGRYIVVVMVAQGHVPSVPLLHKLPAVRPRASQRGPTRCKSSGLLVAASRSGASTQTRPHDCGMLTAASPFTLSGHTKPGQQRTIQPLMGAAS